MKWGINIKLHTVYNESTYTSSFDKFCTVANDLKFMCLWYSANYHNPTSICLSWEYITQIPYCQEVHTTIKVDQTDCDPMSAGQGIVRWTTVHWEDCWVHGYIREIRDFLSWIKYHLALLKWRHNERDGVSNHQAHGCLLNRLFRRRSKKTSKLRVIGLCAANSPVTGEFPAQRASNAENVSIWWRHHALTAFLSHLLYNVVVGGGGGGGGGGAPLFKVYVAELRLKSFESRYICVVPPQLSKY